MPQKKKRLTACRVHCRSITKWLETQRLKPKCRPKTDAWWKRFINTLQKQSPGAAQVCSGDWSALKDKDVCKGMWWPSFESYVCTISIGKDKMIWCWWADVGHLIRLPTSCRCKVSQRKPGKKRVKGHPHLPCIHWVKSKDASSNCFWQTTRHTNNDTRTRTS